MDRTVIDFIWNSKIEIACVKFRTMCCRPFLLQSKASYTAIGVFSLASYPYSFKLLWSPIVDSLYNSSFGRRKSWVVPIQLMSAAMMLVWASWADQRLQVR